MGAPLVSVIIPTYNHAAFLKKALDSVINQSYPHWEVLVVNNFSTDATEAIVASYKDERIKLINFHNNGVIAASRNKGLEQAAGEYVAFLDSDDSWYPNKLKSCVEFMQQQNCDFICHGEDLFEGDKIIATWCQTRKMTYFDLLLNGNRISTSAVMIKNEVIKNVGIFSTRSEFITAEDYELWLRILKKDFNFKFFAEVLGGHLKHSSNQSAAVLRHFNATIIVVDKNIQEMKPGLLRFVYKSRAHSVVYFAAARQWLSQGNVSSAFKFVGFALRSNPFRWKNYALLIWIIIRGLIGRKSAS